MSQGPAYHHHGAGRLNMPFVGIPSFLRAAICTNLGALDADIAVMGVPTDEGSPFMPGSRFGPRAIREHSLRFVSGEPGYYDPRGAALLSSTRCRRGDRRRGRRRRPADQRRRYVPQHHRHGRPGPRTGGDAGRHRRRPRDQLPDRPGLRAEPLHVVHFDAHLDYAPFIHGLEYTNSHAFRHITRMPHVQSITQVGIRSLRNTQTMMEDSHAGREPRRDDGGVPGRVPRGVPGPASPGTPGLREHRHRRARPAARPRLRLGRAERPALRRAPRRPSSRLAEHAEIVGSTWSR